MLAERRKTGCINMEDVVEYISQDRGICPFGDIQVYSLPPKIGGYALGGCDLDDITAELLLEEIT